MVTAASPEIEPAENVAMPVKAVDDSKGVKEPNEAFFGSLLLSCLALSLIAATGYFGLVGYRYFKQAQVEKAIPSIESLQKEVPTIAQEKKESSEKPASESLGATEKPAVIDKKTLSIKVLNGGSTKGVAGAYAEKLKQAGFTGVAIGNSIGNYAGQTLYYAKDQVVGANVIKEEVMKAYPKLVVKEATTSDKDAAVATFVLIIGR